MGRLPFRVCLQLGKRRGKDRAGRPGRAHVCHALPAQMPRIGPLARLRWQPGCNALLLRFLLRACFQPQRRAAGRCAAALELVQRLTVEGWKE